MGNNVFVSNLEHNLGALPNSFVQATVTSSAATALSLYGGAWPAGMRYLEVQAEGAVRFRTDGSAPTTTSGFALGSGERLHFSEAEAQRLRLIAGSDTTIHFQPKGY